MRGAADGDADDVSIDTDGTSEAPAPLVPPGLDATLVLVRHGESEFIVEGRFQGQTDSPLSAFGRRQAAAVGARIAEPGRHPILPIPAGLPVEIVHSPLARAADTAAAIADALVAAGRSAASDRVPTRPDRAFIEIGQGAWEGRLADEIATRWGDALAAWRADPIANWAPEGESVTAVDARLRPGLAAMLARLGHGRAPGTTNRSGVLGYGPPAEPSPWSVLVAHDGALKVALLAILDLPLARFWSFPFGLCAVTVVEFVGGRARLRAHNLADHLSEIEDAERLAREAARRASGAL